MSGKKLLVADDSLTIQKVIRLALSNEGYEIQAISDGVDAIQQIATFRPDCVLIDVSLPSRTAFEIKREVNGMEDHGATKFVLMSSAFEKIDETQAGEVGFDGRLTKPFDPAHLRQVLTEVLTAPSAARATPPKSFPNAPAPEFTPPPLPQIEAPGFSPASEFSLEPPKDFPPADFEISSPGELGIPESVEKSGAEIARAVSEAPGNTGDDDELWGRHVEPTSRDEIKELTESTIRMSGLADWEVQEPSLKPPTSFSDVGESSFRISTSHSAHPSHSNQSSPSISRQMPAQELPPPLPEFTFEPDDAEISRTPEPEFETASATAAAAASRQAERFSSPQIAMPSDSRIEEMVRRQVQEMLEKMARQILPEVAERVIKSEINKLLNEKI